MSANQDLHHYLPVDNQAIQWGLYVTGTGRAAIRSGKSYPPPGHPGPYDFRWKFGRTLPEFQVLLITDGTGQFESEETGRVEVTDGTLMFLFPDVWHRYHPDPQSGWTERWLSFNGELAHRLMDQGPICPASAVRPVRNPREVKDAFDHLLDDTHTPPAMNSMLLSLRAMSLLAITIEAAAGDQLAQFAPETGDQLAASLVVSAVDFIWTHSHYPITVAKIAKALGVNRRTLERRFAAERGRSILAEINNCRLSRAKRLLEETNLPIKVIIHLAGFTSQQRMRATFLERDGILPSDYRKAMRKA